MKHSLTVELQANLVSFSLFVLLGTLSCELNLRDPNETFIDSGIAGKPCVEEKIES